MTFTDYSTLLTEKAAGEYLGLSRTSLYRMRIAGRIAYVNLADEGKAVIRYRREDLDRLIQSGLKNVAMQ